MESNLARFASLLLALVLLCSGALAPGVVSAQVAYEAERPSPAAMMVDGVVVRPLGLVATAVGAVVWVVTLPFSAIAGSVGDAGDALVNEPARFTFKRPMGVFPR